MYYKKNLIGLLICLLFFTHTVYGSYLNSYPITIPTENPITKPSLIGKKKEIPKPNPYIKFVKDTIILKNFNYVAPGAEIVCPTSAEEANAMLDSDFGGNVDEWSKFLTCCYIKYSTSYDLFEKKIIILGKDISEGKIGNFRKFYNYVLSSYTTSLLDKNSLALLLSSVEPNEKLAIRIREMAEPYLNNLIASWDQAIKNATDPNELDIIANHRIKEAEERIFKFMQCFGYCEFFTYILSDNFTNKCTIDEVLFKKIIIFAKTNILELANRKEIFTDLFSLFKVKLKEKEYAPGDKKREAMEFFMITCQEETNKLILNLEKQATEYMQKAEHTETEIAKIKIQMKQKIDEVETEKTKLTSKISVLEEQKQESITEQKESQDKIRTLEKQKAATEIEKKQLQTATKAQEEKSALLEKETERLKKEIERFRETIENQEKTNKEYIEILKTLEKKSEQKTQELNSVTKDFAIASKYNEQLQQQNEQIKKEQNELKKQAQLYEQSLENAKKQSDKTINQFENQLADIKKKLAAATEQAQLWQQKNEAIKTQQIASDKQREQKIKEQDVAAKLAKQQNEDIINELKKTNQQLEQQIKQLNKQLQLLKPQEKQKLSTQQEGDAFFNIPKSVDRERIIANLQQIQQEFQEAQIIPDLRAPEGGWPKLAFVIDFLIQKYTAQDK